MLSLDPWTVTPRGYPLLLQSGESYHGEPLHDRQHPHDFWMEVGATYERPITKSLGIALTVVQLLYSIKTRDQRRDVTGDPWDGRTLEWLTLSPPPHYNFAVLPDVPG